MATNRVEGAKAEADRAEKRPDGAAAPEAGKPAAAANPMQAWFPLIGAVVLLPVVAYLVTTFVLVPKLQKGLGITAATPAPAKEAGGHGAASGHGAAPSHGESESGGGHGAAAEGEGPGPGGRDQVPLTKLVVNVSGTSASRILLASLILVGTTPDFRTAIKEHDAQLRDTACGILGTKGIQDLEKPGARNMIRSELITAFNHVLGSTAVQEIYFTDFAVQ